MGLFNKEPKISINDFCREFYNTQVFNPVVASKDFSMVWWNTAYDSVVEADESFSFIDKTVFIRDMTALRLELFGLALMHYNSEEENYWLSEILFTKSYLKQNGQIEIWDIMSEYNRAIAQAIELPLKVTRRDFMPLASEEEVQKSYISFIKYLRTDMLNKWVEGGVDLDCATRIANRFSNSNILNERPVVEVLTARLASRLGCEINLKPKALFRLSSVIFGLYEGAIEAIKRN